MFSNHSNCLYKIFCQTIIVIGEWQCRVLEYDENLRETWKQVVGPLSKLVIDFKEVTSIPMPPKKISESSGRPNKATIVRVIWFWNFRTVYYPTVTLKQRTNQPDTLDICVTRPTSATQYASLSISQINLMIFLFDNKWPDETNKYLSYLQH